MQPRTVLIYRRLLAGPHAGQLFCVHRGGPLVWNGCFPPLSSNKLDFARTCCRSMHALHEDWGIPCEHWLVHGGEWHPERRLRREPTCELVDPYEGTFHVQTYFADCVAGTILESSMRRRFRADEILELFEYGRREVTSLDGRQAELDEILSGRNR